MQAIAAKTRLMDVPVKWQRRALFPDDEGWLRQEADGRVTVLVRHRPRPFAFLRAPRLERLGDLAPALADELAPLLERAQRFRVRVVDVAPVYQRPRGQSPEIWVSVWARRAPEPIAPARRGPSPAHKAAASAQRDGECLATSPDTPREPRASYPFGPNRKAGTLQPPQGDKRR
ncbi:hypothetical protein [Alkalilacustris brevis]|uniref:hypothetical protein n=1 Tax=Alkalilacustris brevis TaxID=2026338 RepID=UPI0012D2D8DE|nr:hypothetical protein [Alkalilacustris brevis]